MNTAATTTVHYGRTGLFAARGLYDWLFALLVAVGTGYAFMRYDASMDGYERAILIGTAPVVMVNDTYHESMSIEKFDALLQKLD